MPCSCSAQGRAPSDPSSCSHSTLGRVFPSSCSSSCSTSCSTASLSTSYLSSTSSSSTTSPALGWVGAGSWATRRVWWFSHHPVGPLALRVVQQRGQDGLCHPPVNPQQQLAEEPHGCVALLGNVSCSGGWLGVSQQHCAGDCDGAILSLGWPLTVSIHGAFRI